MRQQTPEDVHVIEMDGPILTWEHGDGKHNDGCAHQERDGGPIPQDTQARARWRLIARCLAHATGIHGLGLQFAAILHWLSMTRCPPALRCGDS